MLVPFSNHSWSNDRIRERAFSSFWELNSYPKLRLTKISLQRENVNIKAETVVDAQVSYDFSESGIESLYGLSVLFQVNNLTNEPFTSYFGSDQRLVRDYQNYGRNFMLGANYKF
jgi:iron complex outermembrane receptor protein